MRTRQAFPVVQVAADLPLARAEAGYREPGMLAVRVLARPAITDQGAAVALEVSEVTAAEARQATGEPELQQRLPGLPLAAHMLRVVTHSAAAAAVAVCLLLARLVQGAVLAVRLQRQVLTERQTRAAAAVRRVRIRPRQAAAVAES